jgi:transcriptional regulator with XRE-family HTH domain
MIFLYQTRDMNRIGEQLKIKGCKQKWLAEQLGMTPTMVSSYVKNKTQPKITTLLKISRILNVELTQLVDTSE